jgi:hypothetical protein
MFRAAREADEVGEQDGYEASLGGRGSGRLERGRRVERRAALAAEPLIRLVGGASFGTRLRKRRPALPAYPAFRTGQACNANRLLER